MTLHVRRHGDRGPAVVVLHGGPGAPGSALGLARALAPWFRVEEPWQARAGGVAPLTVRRHVENFLQTYRSPTQLTLIGHSWGAMLALAIAARIPHAVERLALVGCGTFDPASRSELGMRIEARMTPRIRAELAALDTDSSDPDELLERQARLLRPLYGSPDQEPAPEDPDHPRCDARGHHETWADALRQQELGHHPAEFAAIRCPALMLHGADDPHPGRSIQASLRAVLPQLVYREFATCGHEPWSEPLARGSFLDELRHFALGARDNGQTP